MALVQSEGMELTDDQLEAVSGGAWNDYGDEREDFDEALVDPRFIEGDWEDDGLD